MASADFVLRAVRHRIGPGIRQHQLETFPRKRVPGRPSALLTGLAAAGRRRRIAVSADVAIVAMRRPTATFAGASGAAAGCGAGGWSATAEMAGAGPSAVGGSATGGAGAAAETGLDDAEGTGTASDGGVGWRARIHRAAAGMPGEESVGTPAAAAAAGRRDGGSAGRLDGDLPEGGELDGDGLDGDFPEVGALDGRGLDGDGLEWEPLCQVRLRISWVGFSLVCSFRWEAFVSRSSSCRAVGRLCGSLIRASCTSGRSESGTVLMSASPYMIR